MATPKKTVTKKVAAAKSTASKTKNKAASTAKKLASTAKKTTKKTVSTAKKTTAKTTATAKKATKTVKKAAPRVMDSVKSNSVLSFADWRSLVAQAFVAFKSLWWRMGAIILISVLTMMAIMALAFSGVLTAAGGLDGMENEFANVISGTPDLTFIWTVGGAMILLVTAVFVFSSLSRLAMLLTFKNYQDGKPNNPFAVFFKQSWAYVWRYLWLALRITFFMLWPLILLGIVVGALSWQLNTTFGLENIYQFWLWSVGGALFVGLLLWRLVQVIFVDFALIEGNKSSAETFAKARALVNGSWWRVVSALFGFFFFIGVIQITLEMNGIQQDETGALIDPTMMEMVMTTLSSLLSAFVFAPLGICYLYLLMLHLSKTKKIKL